MKLLVVVVAVVAAAVVVDFSAAAAAAAAAAAPTTTTTPTLPLRFVLMETRESLPSLVSTLSFPSSSLLARSHGEHSHELVAIIFQNIVNNQK